MYTVYLVLLLVWENNIQGQFKGIIDHSCQELFEQGGSFLETRISVDLDQPRLQIIIDHKVVSKYLEAVSLAVRIQLVPRFDALETHHDYVLDRAAHQAGEVTLNSSLAENLPGRFKAQLVAFLELTVARAILLDCVVREVDERLIDRLLR